jgi:hypothetical protein
MWFAAFYGVRRHTDKRGVIFMHPGAVSSCPGDTYALAAAAHDTRGVHRYTARGRRAVRPAAP